MFNLEQSIADWRQQMLAAGIKTPVPLEELEWHLREEIEGQMKLGTKEQLAFERSVSQIGQGKELKAEFGKDRGLMSVLKFEISNKEWDMKWTRNLLIFVSPLPLLFFGGMLFLKTGVFSEMTSIERISSLTALVVSCLLSCSGFWGHRIFPIILNKIKRDAFCAASGVLIVLWVMIFLLRMNCKFKQFFVELLWAFFVPFGALIGLILGLERAAQKKDVKVSS